MHAGKHDESKTAGARSLLRGESSPWALLMAVLLIIVLLLFALTEGFGTLVVNPKSSLDEYEWAELKVIASQISDAESEERALEIARKYNLVSESGEIDSANVKSITLGDGETENVAILGFRRDLKADGSGYAGITFCFASPVALRSNDAIPANDGGWKSCDLDQWLEEDFLSNLRDSRDEHGYRVGVTDGLVAVKKQLSEKSDDADVGYFSLLYDDGISKESMAVGICAYQALEEDNSFLEKASNKLEIWLRSKSDTDDSSFRLIDSSEDAADSSAIIHLGVIPVFRY